jgi:hypothetical protein
MSVTELGGWSTREVMVTVKAYPEPSSQHVETVCVAGTFCDTLLPVRLFPVPFRILPPEAQFKKYARIRVNVRKTTSDARPESHRVNDAAGIHIIDRIEKWPDREPFLAKWRAPSIESLITAQRELGMAAAPTLALIRPRSIETISVEPDDAEWSAEKLEKLTRPRLFGDVPEHLLRPLPIRLRYHFTCDDQRCRGHAFSVIDWEVGAAYFSFRSKYGHDGWELKFREKFWDDLAVGRDLQFMVGTIKNHPYVWSINGLYYPPKRSEPDVMNLQLPGLE